MTARPERVRRKRRDMRREIALIDAAESSAEVGGRPKVLLHRLDGLLEYTELSRRPIRPGLVNLRLLVQEVRDELEYEQPIQWHLGDLSTVRADMALLRRVLRELLTNAEQNSRGEPVSVLGVWLTPDPAGRAIFVRNSGEGFGPEVADLLFEPEQRARPGGLMERGMGLATVRRLVERHGSRVWAKGRPGQGATVMFSLSGQALGQRTG